MQKSAKTWIAAAIATLSAATFAAHALAECDEDQETLVGKTVSAAAAAKLATVVPGAGKQMININVCEVAANGIMVDFKFNVIGSDGLYWAQGKAKMSGKTVSDLKFTTLSPNLQAASAKTGIKLASN